MPETKPILRRCLKDIFGYCKDGPDYDKEPEMIHYGTGQEAGMGGATCKLDPKTCKRFVKYGKTTKGKAR